MQLSLNQMKGVSLNVTYLWLYIIVRLRNVPNLKLILSPFNTHTHTLSVSLSHRIPETVYRLWWDLIFILNHQRDVTTACRLFTVQISCYDLQFFFVLSIKEVTLGVSIIFLCEYETDNLLFHNEQCCGRHIFSVIDYWSTLPFPKVPCKHSPHLSTANVTEPNPVIPDNRLFIDRIRIT